MSGEPARRASQLSAAAVAPTATTGAPPAAGAEAARKTEAAASFRSASGFAPAGSAAVYEPARESDAAALRPDEAPAAVRSRARPVLTVDGITVSFDGFKALDRLTLVLDEGELRCLIGPNGAGKTTLMDVITGKTRPDEGAVYLGTEDRDLTKLSEYEIAQLGIGRKFQRPTVFGGHSVLENMELAQRGPKGVLRSLFGRLSAGEKERIDGVLETIGLAAERKTRAGVLSHGQKQWLEIGMLLVQDPKVMLVDEPVAGMTHQETERTAQLLASLAGERTVVVVEHDMDFVRSIARKVTVLHEGRVLSEGTMEQVQNDPAVVEVYLGA